MSISLPIDSLKADFLERLSLSHLVVSAETGSGKSTRLPVWAAERGRVLVVEPRRVACRSLAEFVASERREDVGQTVGYAIRFENMFSDDTQVVFVTPGVALRWLSEDGLASFATVIIDEFHERRWDTDLLLAMLRQKDSHRLVVTSATLDSERLATYLQGECLGAKGRTFNVAVEHIASDSRNMPDIRHIENKVREAIVTRYEAHQDILVFLPGRKEIAQCLSSLKQAFRDQIDLGTLDIIPLHASVSDNERHRALTSSDKQRIILATNVAETSLTIPGVTLIIDTGLERRTHQRNGRTVLGLHAISKASAEQRKGRAGRVTDGTCVRLFGKAAPLELITPPEMHREELVEPMLAAACCGYPLDKLSFVDAVPEKSLLLAREKLLQMQAIDDGGLATEHGQILYPLPIDTLFAHLITAMPDRSSRESMVDLAASLSVYQRIWQMPSGEEAREKLAQWEPKHCDAMALIKLLRGSEPEWLSFDKDVLAEARMLSEQMREALELPALEVATSVKRDAWLMAVMKAAPELVFVRRQKRRQALGNGYSEVNTGRDSRFPDNAEAAIVFDQFALPGKGVKQNLVLATCMAPIALELMNQQGMGEDVFGETRVTDEGCLVEKQRVYAGRVIQTDWVAPEGASAHDTFVEMILDGSILPGLGEKISVDIHQWNLYLALGKYQADVCNRLPEPVAVQKWLGEQIAALGVESADDFELFTCDDFVFDGIPEWERADFDQAYPYQVILTDLTMRIEYHIGRKLVLAVHESGNRKADPKRWELPNWQGWKVQYRKASRTVDVR
ncbi:ATP-dependent RNA helicase [Photobacterium gaetbulicola]|uniref:Putative ATP-dependent helicase n=1 Tax=Photobacterium gaetbulicola Gung47 TaxID=658445 RepID=A0A0C5WB19_9GAMM|nr:helicase-related protein [Photobacterium gaetbulicola]AJR08776.1 putative ATP-dependent helicase [Photobacterium gaetbulicola Gung47]PSU10406.1 ATP-dependent RNA helicase [Photobacterium gaetbulicola]